MNLPLRIVLIFILIILNGVFSASEMALVSVSDAQVEMDANKGKKSAKRVLKLIANPTKFLSAIQIGITVFGFLNGVLASNAFASEIANLFPNLDQTITITVAFIVITLVLTYLQVVLGELVPKRIAMKYPKKIAYGTSGILSVVSLLMRPFVNLLTFSANLITKPLGVKSSDDERKMTEEEIRLIVTSSSNKGVIDSQESKMIQNIFEFDDTECQAIMTHRTEVSGIDIKWSKKQVFDFIYKEKYSRYPIYKGSIDHIVGVLYSKDLLMFLDDPSVVFDIKKIMRKPFFIPETKNTRELFQEMQKTKNHIAIVIDEYGGTSGLITMEDLIEEILGNIFDEYDEVEEEIEKIDDNAFIIDGLANIDDIEEELHIGLPIEDYDTVSGFIIGHIGRIPEANDVIVFEYNGFILEVIDYDGNVIERVKITKPINKKDGDE